MFENTTLLQGYNYFFVDYVSPFTKQTMVNQLYVSFLCRTTRLDSSLSPQTFRLLDSSLGLCHIQFFEIVLLIQYGFIACM